MVLAKVQQQEQEPGVLALDVETHEDVRHRWPLSLGQATQRDGTSLVGLWEIVPREVLKRPWLLRNLLWARRRPSLEQLVSAHVMNPVSGTSR